jgi:hypothetical protein
MRSTVDWGLESDLMEPVPDVRGDIARALMYMAIRYDGEDNDAVSDLELLDFLAESDPGCCFDDETTSVNDKGCIRKTCQMGQLSILLGWHMKDPPDDFERQRNEKVHRAQGNRNLFVDHPQLAWLLFESNGISDVFADCGVDYSIIKTASWNNESSELTLVVDESVPPFYQIDITVPSFVGLRLPEAGMTQNSRSLKMYANLSGRQLAPQFSIQSSPIGPFTDVPIILFHNPYPSSQSNIFIALRMNCDILPFDTLRISLPGFSIRPVPFAVYNWACRIDWDVHLCQDIKCLSDCLMGRDDDTKIYGFITESREPMIEIKVHRRISRNEQLLLTLETENGIILPESAISKADSNISLFFVQNQKSYTVKFKTQAVGTFMGTSLISYSKKVLNDPVDITVSFTPDMLMSAMDSIFIRLPAFQQAEPGTLVSIANVTALSTAISAELVAIWTPNCDSLNQTLVLMVREGSFLLQGHSYSFNVRDLNIAMPGSALQKNQPTIIIESDCAEGPVGPESVKSDAVANIRPDFISFWPSLAGNKTSIRVSIFSGVSLEPGDFLFIHLTNFSGIGTDCVQTENLWPKDWCTSVGWNENTSELSLRISSFIQTQTYLELTVPLTAGIILPSEGIAHSSNSIVLRANTFAGIMDYTPFATVVPVGTFATEPSLNYNPAEASQTTEITLKFKPSMDIEDGEILILKLRGITSNLMQYGPEREIKCFVSQSLLGSFWNGTWNATSSELVIHLPSITALSSVLVVIPSIAGLKIPASGLLQNDPGINISLFSENGIITEYPIQSPAVGALTNTEIRVLNNISDSTSLLIVSFSVHMDLEIGDAIEMVLAGFNTTSSLEISTNFAVESDSNSIFSKAFWNSQYCSLGFFTIKRVSAGSNLSGVIGPFSGTVLSVPTKSITIETNAKNGPVAPTSFEKVVGFGPIPQSPKISFYPANAGLNTSMNVTFDLNSFKDSHIMVSLSEFDLYSARQKHGCVSSSQVPDPNSIGVDLTYMLQLTNFAVESKLDLDVNCSWKQVYTCYNSTSLFLTPCICVAHHAILDMTVTTVAGVNVDSSHPVTILFSEDNGIIIPPNGTVSNPIQVSSSTTASINTEYTHVGYFMDGPRIEDFSNPIPGGVSAINFSFVLGTQLSHMEQIDITLPGFSGDFTTLLKLEGASGGRFSGSWIPSQQRLILFVRCVGDTIAPGERVVIVVPSSLRVRLPFAGIPANASELVISINSEAGLYGPISFVSSPGVGLFLSTSLSFLPPKAGEVCSIILQIKPLMKILQGSRIFLELPDFGGENVISGDVTSDGGVISTANWTLLSVTTVKEICTAYRTLETLSVCTITRKKQPFNMERVSHEHHFIYLLTLAVSQDIPEGKETRIEIGSSLKISLPSRGLSPNQESLTIATNTPNQPVAIPSRISKSPGIYLNGSFQLCNVTFGPSKPMMAGNPTDIKFQLIPKMTFVDQDVVTFHLAGFTGPSHQNFEVLSTPPGLNATGTWDQNTEQLQVKFQDYYENGTDKQLSYLSLTLVTFIIPKSIGIAIPKQGLQLNSENLLVSTMALSGPVRPTPLRNNPAVYSTGFFSETVLTYNSFGLLCTKTFGGLVAPGFDLSRKMPSTVCTEQLLGQGRAGTNTSVYFTFVAGMNLFPDDNISINLTSWTSPSAMRFVFVLCNNTPVCECGTIGQYEAGLCASAQYMKSGNLVYESNIVRLTFTVSDFVPAYERIVIFIPHTFGLKIPLQGLRLNDRRLTVETDAVAGPLPPIPVLTSEAVGSFGSTPSLRFHSSDYQAAGVPTALEFSFVPSMFMSSYETIVLHLPGFSGQSTVFSEAQSIPVYCNPSISHLLGCGSVIRVVTWNANTCELSMMVEGFAAIPANQLVTVTIPTGAGIITPMDGVASNQLALTLRTSAVAGPVPPTPISSTQHVGLFAEQVDMFPLACSLYSHCPFPFSSSAAVLDRPLISFEYPQAGARTALKVTINPIMSRINSSMDYTGFKISIYINRIQRIAPAAGPVLVAGPFAQDFIATWNGQCIAMQATAANSLFNRTGPIEIIIPSSEGFVLYEGGNTQNDVNNYVTIEVAGQSATTVLVSPAIGVLLQPTISYSAAAEDTCKSELLGRPFPCPRKQANILFSFVNVMRIFGGDTLRLLLPLFEGPSVDNFTATVAAGTAQPSTRANAAWNTSTGVLSVVFSAYLPAGSRITVTAASSAAGIRIPSSGVSIREAAFMFSVDAVMGSIVWTGFASTSEVLSILSDFQLGIQPTQPGDIVTLGCKFRPLASSPLQIVLRPGDKVMLLLPGFQRAMVDDPALAGNVFTDMVDGLPLLALNMTASLQQPPDAFSNVYWYGTLSALVLTVAIPVTSRDVSFYISSAYGIRTPTQGLRSRDPSLQISGIVGGVRILPSPCSDSTPVGFSRSAVNGGVFFSVLQVDYANPDVPAGLKLSFALVIEVKPPDVIRVDLPDFYRLVNESPMRVASQPLLCSPQDCFGPITMASWAEAGEQLLLTLTRRVAPMTNLSVAILPEHGIYVPRSGLILNQQDLKVSCVAEAGTISATPFEQASAVGYFAKYPHIEIEADNILVSLPLHIPLPGGTTNLTLALPEFRGANTTLFATADNLCEPVLAFWQSGTLVLALPSDIAPEAPITVAVRVPLGAGGLLPPLYGIAAEPPFPAHHAAMGSFKTHITARPVGAVDCTRLAADPPAAGVVVSLSLQFVAHMPLSLGDEIDITLPGFVGPDASQFTVFSQRGAAVLEPGSPCTEAPPTNVSTRVFEVALWDRTSSTMTLMVNQALDRGFPVLVVTDGITAQFRLPKSGLVADDPALTLAIRAGAGSVAPAPIQHTPGIGAFRSSALSFTKPAAAGFPGGLELAFLASFKLNPGDRVALRLPSFVFVPPAPCWGLAECRLALDFGPPDVAVFWFNNSLDVVFASKIYAGSAVSLRIPAAAGLILPPGGVRANEMGIQISAVAAEGGAPPAALHSVAPVGSLEGTDALSLDPPLAGAAAAVTFAFRAPFPLAMGDSVALQLPGFAGSDSDSIPVTSAPASAVARATWHNTTGTLTLRVTRAVPPGAAVVATVAATAGLVVPPGGITLGAPGFVFSAAAVAGPIPETIMSRVPAVGVFQDSALAFEPSLADGETPVRVGLNFTYARAAKSGEHFFLRLAGFVRAAAGDAVNATSTLYSGLGKSVFAEAVWDLNGSVLKLTLDGPLSAGAVLGVTVPGFLLPSDGVRADDPDLTLATDAYAGPVLPTPVRHTPAVGALADTALDWSPRRAGAEVALSVAFSPAMTLAPGEIIEVYLPGWSGPPSGGNFSAASTPAGHFTMISWEDADADTGAGGVLRLTVAANIPALTAVIVAVGGPSGGAAGGLRQPAEGTTANQRTLRIATNARAGPALPSPIRRSPAVTVVSGARLELRPAVAGEVAAASLSFRLDRSLGTGDTVHLALPGFTSEVCTAVGVAELCSLTTTDEGGGGGGTAWWNASSGEVIFDSVTAFARAGGDGATDFGPVRVLGLRLPIGGVRGVGGRAGVTLTVRAARGDVDALPVTNVTAAGAFASPPSVAFPPGAPSAPAAVVLLATPLFDLLPGEVLALTLCGFGGDNVSISPDLLSGPSAALFRAMWTGAPAANDSGSDGGSGGCTEPQLILTAAERILAGAALNLTIAASAGIVLPAGGVLSAAASAAGLPPAVLLISSDALDGPIVGAPLELREELDAALAAELYAFPLVAGEGVSLSLNLTLAGPSPRGRTCFLALPGFTRDPPVGAAGASSNALAADGGAFLAVWVAAGLVGPGVRLTASRDLAAGEAVRVVLPLCCGNGLRLPADGLPRFAGTAGVTITCAAVRATVVGGASAAAGALPAAAVTIRTPVGAFRAGSTAAAFDPPTAGRPCSATLLLTLTVALQPGERVTAALPGFSLAAAAADGWLEERGAVQLIDDGVWLVNLTGMTEFDGGATAFRPAANWSERAAQLTLSVAQNIPAGTPLAATVPSSAGLRLPAVGVRAGGPGFTLACDAADGPIVPVPLATVTPVGAFNRSTLRFGPAPRAGVLANTTISFAALMPLAAGDVVTIDLGPGFSLGPAPATAAFTFPSTWANVSVEGGNETVLVRLAIARPVPAGTNVATTVHGLRLPPSGVGPAQGPTLAAAAAAGPAHPTRLAAWQRVGAVLDPRLSFDLGGDGAADGAVGLGIAVAFRLYMELSAGDRIFVGMPDFQRDAAAAAAAASGGGFAVVCGGNSTALVEWDAATETLSLSVVKPPPPPPPRAAGPALTCVVPATFGLRPPTAGFDDAASVAAGPAGGGLSIASDAAAGPIVPEHLPATGSVARLSAVSVAFDPPVAGRPCAVRLMFRSSSPFASRDPVRFRLPFLALPRPAPPPGAASAAAGRASGAAVFFTDSRDWTNATWDAAGALLTLFASRRVPGAHADGGSHQVLIGTAIGFELAAGGTRGGGAWARALAAAAPSPPATIAVQSVGAFDAGGTRVTFLPPTGANFVAAGRPAVVALRVVALMDVRRDEALRLRTPGFTVPTALASAGVVASCPSGNVTVEWDAAGETLVLALRFDLAAGVVADINISGVELPPLGVAPAAAAAAGATAAAGVFLSATAADGAVNGWPVRDVQAVGALAGATLAFTRPLADAVTGITLSFTVSISLPPDGKITLFLPGFTLTSGPQLAGPQSLSGGCGGAAAACIWDAAREQLSAHLTGGAPPLTLLIVEVPYAAGLRLPSRGVQRNDPRIALEVPPAGAGAGGPVPPTPVLETQAVGAMWDSALEYSQPLAGQAAAIRVIFTYSRWFDVQDQVRAAPSHIQPHSSTHKKNTKLKAHKHTQQHTLHHPYTTPPQSYQTHHRARTHRSHISHSKRTRHTQNTHTTQHTYTTITTEPHTRNTHHTHHMHTQTLHQHSASITPYHSHKTRKYSSLRTQHNTTCQHKIIPTPTHTTHTQTRTHPSKNIYNLYHIHHTRHTRHKITMCVLHHTTYHAPRTCTH